MSEEINGKVRKMFIPLYCREKFGFQTIAKK